MMTEERPACTEKHHHVHTFAVPLEPEPGGWCDRCLLPSMVRVRVFLLQETMPVYRGPMITDFGIAEYCEEGCSEPAWVK